MEKLSEITTALLEDALKCALNDQEDHMRMNLRSMTRDQLLQCWAALEKLQSAVIQERNERRPGKDIG